MPWRFLADAELDAARQQHVVSLATPALLARRPFLLAVYGKAPNLAVDRAQATPELAPQIRRRERGPPLNATSVWE